MISIDTKLQKVCTEIAVQLSLILFIKYFFFFFKDGVNDLGRVCFSKVKVKYTIILQTRTHEHSIVA